MNNEIDYTLLEQARVMIFAAHGAAVEMFDEELFDDWFDAPLPLNWHWYTNEYRISPDWLKVPEGWEIVPLGESIVTDKIKTLRCEDETWVDCAATSTAVVNADCMRFFARPIAKPKPRRVPLTKADWDGQPLWWVRKADRDGKADELLVSAITTKSVIVFGELDLSFEWLMENTHERSHDRKTWTPCWKEGEQ